MLEESESDIAPKHREAIPETPNAPWHRLGNLLHNRFLMDFLAETGGLGLGSRLKRLSDRMMQDGAGIYQDLGIDFKPSWFPTFNFLYRRGPTPLGVIAQELGVTHVAINQVLEELEQRALAVSETGSEDRRVRIARLTDKGMGLANSLEEGWGCIRASILEAIEETGYDFLDATARLEICLNRSSLRERFRRKWFDTVEIVPFAPEYRDAFWEINSAWIREHFALEPIDERILKNPEAEVIERGGAIFFARDRRTRQILGTCALMEHGGEWELAKMGVRPEARGRGVGMKLAAAVIAHARKHEIRKLVLETNSKLKPAINLYRKLGFVHVPSKTDSDYARSDVRMELEL
jgi:ribosomal protein S18 acetylase RimI-like enzyme